MDTRANRWFGQLQLTGIAEPKNHSGSIVGILGEILKDLQELNPRTLSSGEKEIVIRIRDKPYGSEKESNRIADIAAEVMQSLTDVPVTGGPTDGESYDQYVERLLSIGHSESSAIFLASDWFEREPPEDLMSWMNDSKAQRFRKLNGNQEAFDSALPMEYETLKHYVISEYPQFTANLTFRTA